MLTLTSSGGNFPPGLDAIVRYGDVETGPTTTVVSANGQTLTATFTGLGVATSGSSAADPYVFFVDGNGVRHLAC